MYSFQHKVFSLIIIVFVLIGLCSGLSMAAVVAINAGGSSYTAADGTTYGADTYFNGGSTYSVANAISSTSADTLYQSLRYGYGSEFSYNIPITDGAYDVTIRFAELYYDNAGDQVFSVSIERTEVISGLDILDHAAKFEAYDVTIPSVIVDDGELNITFIGENDATVCAIEVNVAASQVNISADPFQIDPGGSSTLTWSAANADTVSIDNGIGVVALSGSISVSPTVTTIYTITADGPGGTALDNTTVVLNSPVPTVTISASPVYIAEGGTTTLTWTSTNATFASIDNEVGAVDTNGTIVVSPQGTGVITYIITADGPGGTAQDSVDITVNSLPTVSITSDITNITIGESATITWSSSDADTVDVQPIGSSALSGSQAVTPAVTTTYTITGTNTYGSKEDRVTVMVDQSPTVSISASPAEIVSGSSSTLTWTSEGADTVNIDQGIGEVSLNGSLSITPTTQTQYTITATNAYGTATGSVTISVSEPSTASITASLNPINAGESTTLTWSSMNADSAAIDPTIGSVEVNGSTSVSPVETTTYTLTVDGPGGVATHSTTVMVNQVPIVSLSAEPAYIGVGDSATLTWTSTNAASASIDQAVGVVEVNGSTIVSPAVTTTYTITAEGPGGTATDSATITVHPIPTVTISSDLATINIGESATLTWTSADATTATINAMGHVDLNGTAEIWPLVTTTYTIIAEGPGGSASDSVTVSIASQMSVAVNCGGGAYTALDGTNYVADTYYTGGNVYSTSNAIASTSDDELYQSQRYGYGSDFSYAIPLADWNYDITFRFTEMYYENIGDQIFSVTAEGTQIITDLDVLSQASKYEAYDVTITSVNVSDGVLNLTFSGANDAAVCAIQVVPTLPTASISATPNPLVEGQTAILSWNSADSTAASIDYGIGEVAPNVYSSTGVSPVTATTYTITVDGPGGSATESVILDVNNLPVVDISSSSGTITEGEDATLSWTTSYADTLSIDQGIGDVTGTSSYNVSPVATTTYTITAANAYGSRTDSVTITVNSLPVINTFEASPNPIIVGASSTLSWTSTSADAITINQGIGDVTGSTSSSVSPTETTVYTITATNSYGSRTADVTVEVGNYPMVSISASPGTITEGASCTLSWYSANTDTTSIDQGIGSVTPNDSGSQSVSPVITTTYTITATNVNGTSTDSVTVTVNNLPVINSFTVDLGTIIEETSATLSWSVTNADTVGINQGIGAVSTSGTQAVTPSVTTTYTLTAVNSYGARSSNVTIIVNQLPTVNISALPASISEGETPTLNWHTTNADSAIIDQGIGTVSVNSSTTVSPAVTTTYTITATNSYGSRTDTATVTVNTPPTIESFTTSLSTITEGGSTILSWSSTGGTFASIDQGVGSVAVSGSATVSPLVTTTYTLTVSNTFGSDTAGITVAVDGLPQVSIAALPDAITEGESSTLSWSSFNADSVSIDGGIGTVTANTPGTQTLSPAVTTTYTITAVNTIGSRSANVTVTVNMLPTVSISADATTICEGSSATLSWSSTDADTLTLNQGIGDVTGTTSYSVSPSATTTYTLTAINSYGRASQTITITVDPLPSAAISASTNPINEGDSTTLSWTSSDATSLALDQGIGDVTGTTSYSVSPSATTTYNLTATNTCGDTTDSVTVTVYNVPTVSISAASSTIDEGGSTTLSWTSASATSASIDQGIGSVDVNGSTTVAPVVTTTYTITVTGPAGTGTDSVTVSVNPLPVIESFAASPSSIASGGSSTLYWTTSDVTSLGIDSGIGDVTGTTSYSVSPSVTTTYTLTAANAVGSRQKSVTVVMVGDPPAIDSFSANPGAIVSGDSSTLSWWVSGADSVSIDQLVGTVSSTGTVSVSPDADTTYTITATNTYGTDTETVTVTVGVQPTVTISASPGTITEEESATLSWTSTDATIVEIDQGIGSVITSGSQSVSPVLTTTYTATASSQYGTATSSTTVTVNNLPVIHTFAATPSAIVEGGSTTLSWTTTGAGMAEIDQGVGSVGINSSTTVSPLVTTVYTLTTTNTFGSHTASVTVTVHNLPTVSLSSNLTTITEGETATLTWSSTDAASVSIDHGIGAVATSGSTVVSPVVTTSYRITATNTYGSDSQVVTITVNNLPVVSMTATPETITEGESATLVWSATNADSATIDQSIGAVELSDSLSVRPSVTTTYTLTATNINGSRTAAVTVTVGLVPTVTLSAIPAAITEGEAVTLSWSSTDATTVNIDHGVGTVTATGTVDIYPIVTTTYTAMASNAYGTASSSVTVTVNTLPVVSITASPETIAEGESATLSWSSSNADSVSIDQGIGAVTENTTGSQTVSPAVTTVYTITATNTNGTATANVTVTVNPLPVITSFTADVSTITEGQSVTLSWTTDADSTSIDQGIGAVDPIGSISASPVLTTTYTLTAANAYGSSTTTVTVTVNNLPTVSLSADLSTITEGETATLSWSATNADALSIDQEIGDVTGTTSFSISPALTTTYTITATNTYGTATDSVTVTVNNLPVVSLDVDPVEIIIGETSSLSWSSSNAESVYLNQGLGSQLANVADSTGVSPTVDTTYVIIATNAYGTRTASADITVLEVPLPEVSISADPNLIASGETSILSWMSSNANTLGIEPDLGIGTIEPDVASTTGVSPTENTTYTITATNQYGSVSESVTIVVGQLPFVSISATEETITEGQTTTLIWDSINAESSTLTQDVGTSIGDVAASGTIDVEPLVTTVYTVIAHNSNGDSDPADVTITVNPLPTIDTFATSASSINNGGTATLSWTTTSADSASIDHGIGIVGAANGSTDVSPLVSTTYTIAAWNDYGMVSSSLTITVTQLPIVGISASPEEITAGDTSTLTWTASNANIVSIDQEIGEVDQSGLLSVTPAVTTTYTITATNGNGSVTDSVTITVGDLPVIDTFIADPAAITQGESSTMTWSVTGADTVSINQGIGDVTGTTSYSVSPSATTTYTLTAANAYGSVTGSVTVTVGQLPSVDISVSPETITEGGTATLTWTSVNAESCIIDQGIGTVAQSGSVDVSPSVTTTYTITATNISGEDTDSVTVTVNNLPAVSISADPVAIVVGSSSTLSWTSTNADSVSLSHGIGNVDLNGSTSVSPSFTTTYTITAANAFGSVTGTVTVTVYDVPSVIIDAEPVNIITGGLTTLTWTSTDATTASIDQSIGSVDPSGSVSVSPTVTTTYTITVDGPGGTATDSVTVGVHDSVAVNITASPETIVSGEQSVLFWDSTGAYSLSIDGGIGEVALDGWKNVSPAVTTTYTISTNGGVVTDTATVTVVEVPTVSISASPDTINEGETAVLTWTSTDADSASLDNAIGAVEVNGSTIVSPAVTTAYTITVNGAGGSAASSVVVTVNGLPTVSISANQATIIEGESATLSWTSTSADTLILIPGDIDVTGTTSYDVSPLVTTEYTITAANAYGTATDSVTVTVYPNPTVTMSADATEIVEGASATLSWTSTDAESASINQGIGSVDVNGSKSVSPAVTTTYTITVTGLGGTATDTVALTVNQLPNVNISASPNNIASGGSTALSWSSSNTDTVSIDQGIGAVALSGSTSVSPSVTTTYTITATNTYGATTDSVTIMVEEPPTVSITASPAEIAAGSQATLSWTSSGADSVSINQGIGTVALEGVSVRTPAVTTTYTITATNTYGTDTDSVTVTVHPLPSVDISASPTVINISQSATLSWTSTNATSASIDSGIGSVAVSGSMSVAPTVTTTYTITVTGSGGSATDSVTVSVNQAPTVNITSDPTEMVLGETATLTWTSTNAISASIDQSIGTVSVNGSTTVTPAVTTTYTITVDGPGGTATDSVTVTISNVVSVSISASVSAISLSESTTLSWTSANADSASIDQGIGAVAVNGSRIVTPASTRTYTITVEGTSGTASVSVEVVVYQPPEVTLTAEPDRIISGDSSTLTWTSVNAGTVTIDPEIGAVAASGTMEVFPEITTIYTITAGGDWDLGVATDSVTVGVSPREAAFIPTYTVVPGGYSYGIAVVDLEAKTVAYTLDGVGNKPLGIVPDSSLDYIYVSCLADQTVEKIDVFTGEKLAAIDVTDLPRDIAITPDGSRVYVSLHNNEYNGGQNIPVIDTATDTIIDTTSTPNDAKAIDISPDGAWLYASSVYGHSSYDQTFYVSVFDTTTNNDEAVIDVNPYHPFDLVASPDGSRVYIANLEEGLSYIDIDGDSFSFEGPAIVEADKQYIRLEVSPDGAYIFAVTLNWRTYQSGISVIDTADHSLVATIPITQPYEWLSFSGIDVHPVRDELYVVFSDSAGTGLPDFYVIDISDPAAPFISDSLTIGRHDDLYGEFLIVRP